VQVISNNMQNLLHCLALHYPSSRQPYVIFFTGAGKSSIVGALLRLRPIQSGFIMVQGDDASTLNLRELRGRFGVVPQSPVLFGGSIRDNLDPWGRASDAQLTAALQVGWLCWFSVRNLQLVLV
jgi:ATP-binding cassette subfamily C (CFTR/MRP) protein 10